MISSENQDLPEIFTKFSNEKTKEWNDISLTEMLGKFSDLKDLDKKDKWNDIDVAMLVVYFNLPL